MAPTIKSRQRLRPTWTGAATGKLHLTLNRTKTLCGEAIPAKHFAQDDDRSGRWFNDDSCRSCAKVAQQLERGCTRCPAILFTPDHVRRGVCPACHRKKRMPKPRPSQIAAQRAAEKQRKAAEKQAKAPWTTWPPPAPPTDDGRSRPLVHSWGHAEALMRLQRTFDLLDQRLMAEPYPVAPEIVVGRQQTTDGHRYTFHHPTVGLLGELRLLVRYGGALHYEALCAGHPDDPMSTRRVALLDPTMKRLMARLDQPDLMPPVPAQGHIPVVTTARAYLDPERLRTRDYHCTRCAAGVAQVVLADGVLEDAIRLVLGERPLPLLPI